MGKFFAIDSPLMRGLSKMADLFWINILTIILCIPIVTAGAAFTALHYTCLKLVRDEESYVTKNYFKSFKDNLIQSTIIWIIALVLGLVLGFDFYLIRNGLIDKPGAVMTAGLGIATVLFLCTLVFVFPLQSHFVNTVGKTIKNAFLMSMTVLPKTVLMVLAWLIPIAGLVLSVLAEMHWLEPLCILFCFSLPAYLSALLYNKTFKKYEPNNGEDTNDDFSWSVDSDLTEGAGTEEDSSDAETETVSDKEESSESDSI